MTEMKTAQKRVKAKTTRSPSASQVSLPLDVDSVLADEDTSILVCCGSGGVGKTTTAAALALRAAEQGRTVCVVTIDPARRLAQSLGLVELDNTPRAVLGYDKTAGGSLDAMMLDMKSTFDEVIEAHATPEKAAEILSNPFYVALSSSFAGTQEYMAMEKLGQLHALNKWDLIVVDTPPSRSALDFLDAPERLSTLLDGRFIKLLLAPAKGPARLLTTGFGFVTSTLNKVLGSQVLTDMQTFVAAFDTLFGGFKERAKQTFAILQDESTAFFVIATAEPAALREASYFVERLAADAMPLAGVVINRVHDSRLVPITVAEAESVSARLAQGTETEISVGELLDVHAERLAVALKENHLRERFSAAHHEVPVAAIPALAGDVHDLEGLRLVGESLAS